MAGGILPPAPAVGAAGAPFNPSSERAEAATAVPTSEVARPAAGPATACH